MIAVIYRFHLQPHQEETYKKLWNTIASYFVTHRGALGSCLHKGPDGLWVAYSRWPDLETRDASWPGDDAPAHELPENVKSTIVEMQKIKEENTNLPQLDEIVMDVVDDMLVGSKVSV